MKKIIFIILLAAHSAFSQVNLSQGIIAYYPLNFSPLDSSANNLDLTINGTPVSAFNRFGVTMGAYTINAAHPDYFTAPMSPLFEPTELSVSAWVKLINPMTDQKIAGHAVVGGGFLLGVDSNKIDAEIWDLNATHYRLKSGSITAGTWTHLVMTYKMNDFLKVYINGIAVDSIASANYGAGTTAAWPFTIGGAPWQPTALNATGSIDDIYIYNRAINAAEVAALFVLTPTAVNENDLAFTSLYPVPAKELLYINSLNSSGSLYIYNVEGLEVLKTDLDHVNNVVDIDFLSPGIYFASLAVADNVRTWKIVKE